MNRLLIELNREYTKSEINKHVDSLYDDIKKMSEENYKLKKTNASIQKEKNKLAYAYARKIGVILTRKEYIRKFEKKKCFCGGDKDFKPICKECSRSHGSRKVKE